MISVVGRSQTLASAFKATAQAVPSSIKELVPGVVVTSEKIKTAKPLPFNFGGGQLKVTSGIGGKFIIDFNTLQRFGIN